MSNVWYVVLGLVVGLILMLPVARILLRRAEHRARVAERRARNAERLAELGSMTSGLAHEIKNPLSTVSLNAQLLAEQVDEAKGLDDDQRGRMLRRIDALRREVERLADILNDFLQFAGRIKLDPQRVDLRTIVEELTDFYHPQTDAHNIVLRTQVPDEPVMASIDVALFKQAVLNLMINATQAMSGRGVEGERNLILRLAESGGEALALHVTDTGPGIEADRLEEIFRPYVSKRAPGVGGGTGLGLPTARRIIEEHGGSLSVHSEVGRGSDFVIELPG